MVSFSCENCGDVLTKKKLDPHRNQCYGASFTCLDCMVHFHGTEYRSHTSCISEAQKYQGALYKEKKAKNQKSNPVSPTKNNSQALVPRNAYVEDAPDQDSGAVAIVDAPPRAPTPPPAPYSLGYDERAALPPVNVFDFLEESATPNASKVQLPPPDESRMIEDTKNYEQEPQIEAMDVMKFQTYEDEEDYDFVEKGYAYGTDTVRPANERFDSYYNVREQEPAFNYTTPAPKPKHERKKSRDKDLDTTISKAERKRKRQSTIGDLDMALVRAQQERDVMMTDAPPVLHSGLTGGLTRLLARPEFPPSPDYSGGDYGEASPLSPMKRSKQSGPSKAFERAQKDFEKQDQQLRKAEREREKEERKEKERGRERERKEKKVTAIIKDKSGKVRLKRRDDSGRETRRPGEDRRRRRQYSSSPSPERERRQVKAIEYHRADSANASPTGDENNALIVRQNGALTTRANGDISGPVKDGAQARAELFMSFVTKGPESERGMSVNKVLKRYHRERYDRWDRELGKVDEEKELWRSMRLRRNDRGEIVLFFGDADI